MIAALYVEKNGCYYGLPDVDPWDIERDARFYPGPYPVVAHPPCARWSKMTQCRPELKAREGQDDGCFHFALWALHLWGGVLEHPAQSKAWRAFGLEKPPIAGGWIKSREGWVCHVEQAHYGHPARKATWLYACVPQPPELIWGPAEQRLPAKRLAERGYESARRCGIVASMSSKQRQRTPIAFRDLLLSIAMTA